MENQSTQLPILWQSKNKAASDIANLELVECESLLESQAVHLLEKTRERGIPSGCF